MIRYDWKTSKKLKDRGEQKAVEIPMLRSKKNLLDSGSYRVKVGEWYRMDSVLGRHVFLHFDVLEEGLGHRSIEGWYNRWRQHSSLAYESPEVFEQLYHQRQQVGLTSYPRK